MDISMKKTGNLIPLMFCTFFVAIASIVYELIIGGISSYLLGNSVYQFSITIGLFMTAMGIGSYLSKYLEDDLMTKFMYIEVLLAFFGGTCGLVLFYSYAVVGVYVPVMFFLIIIIGILTGFELPLLTRIIREYNELKITLANVISADYIGGLIGSVAFPILLLPRFGFITTSFIIGLLNLIVAAFIYFKYFNTGKAVLIKISMFTVAVILIIGLVTVDNAESYLERKLYRDKVIYSEQSKYQKIVVTRNRDDIRLFLNGNIQFSSQDEYRYHEALVHPVFSLVEDRRNVLVLGGGDGLAVREILKYPEVERIDLVDLDKAVTKLAKSSSFFLEYNKNSLENEKVNVINQDAYQFLENSRGLYNIVIVDLPDPNNESLNKLYTTTFYRMIYGHLTDRGAMVVQSTSPYFARTPFWTIHNTIAEANFNTRAYHAYIPSFGDWGFNIGTKNFSFAPEDISIEAETKYLTDEQMPSLFIFGKDILSARENAGINTLTRPVLIKLYYDSWNKYN
ncbi:MAG: polyamine aminopropyltransferase [Bacillota bacterium]